MVEDKKSEIPPKLYGKFQASVFVNGDGITPTHDLVTSLQSELKKYNLFQNVINEQSPMGPKPRVGFVNLDTNLIVALLSNRFDVIVQSSKPENANLGHLSDFLAQSINYLSILLNHFSLKGNRVALISERIFTESGDSEGRILTPRLFKLPHLMENKKSKEFDWRVVANVDEDINNRNETFNTIATIKRGPYLVLEIKGNTSSTTTVETNLVNIQLDINTLVEAQEQRVDQNNITNFFDSASKLHNELDNDIDSLLEGR